MARTYTKPIQILKADEEENWKEQFALHAFVNKPRADDEYFKAGAIQNKRYLKFEFRYFSGLKDVLNSQQEYRIRYDGVDYNITSVDDYKLQHRTVSLLGESVG